MKIRLADGTGTSNLKYVYEDVDRHGNVRVYVKRHKKATKIRLTAAPGTDEFFAQYREALQGVAPAAPTPPKVALSTDGIGDPRSFRHLVSRYFGSADFKQLDPDTQRRRRLCLEAVCAESIEGVKTGPLPFALMQPMHVREIRDQKADTPAEANRRLKDIRAVFNWACDDTVKAAAFNPALAVKRLPPKRAGGWHRMTVQEFQKFEDRHPVGSKPRLALDLLLSTITRRSDVVRLGPHMERIVTVKIKGKTVKVPVLVFTEYKGRNKKPKNRMIPILPRLLTSIAAFKEANPPKPGAKLRALTYLETAYGKSYSMKGFTNRFKEWTAQAEIPHCSPHSVRKGGATVAAERGATTKGLQAMGGWATLSEPENYTAEADLKRLAIEYMHLVEPEQNDDESFPPLPGVSESGK